MEKNMYVHFVWLQIASFQCDLEASQTSELQLSERVKELEATVHRLQDECNSQSVALRDRSADATDSDTIRDLMAEKVSI